MGVDAHDRSGHGIKLIANLLHQIEAIRIIVEVLDLSEDDVRKFTTLLQEWIVADEERRKALSRELRRLLESRAGAEQGGITLSEWVPMDGEVAAAYKAIEQKNRVFGDNLRSLMAGAGLNQEALAARLGVTQSCISQFASGRHKPQPETLRKLADALGCRTEDLWPEEER
jgi:DNA-binding XRE family transcriptional regulator